MQLFVKEVDDMKAVLAKEQNAIYINSVIQPDVAAIDAKRQSMKPIKPVTNTPSFGSVSNRPSAKRERDINFSRMTLVR